jgi:hypothetical protein
MGFEFAARQQMDARRSTPEDLDCALDSGVDLSGDIGAASSLVDRIAGLGIAGETRALTSDDSHPLRCARCASGERRRRVLINPDLTQPQALEVELDPVLPAAGGAFGDPRSLDGSGEPDAPLAPAEVRLIHVKRACPATQRSQRRREALKAASQAARIVIDAMARVVDGGRFAGNVWLASASPLRRIFSPTETASLSPT